jgi:hypothetical protein
MFRAAAIALAAIALASCDMVNTMTEGFKHTKDIANELEASTGLRPEVGFSWNNGKLTSVTVLFPSLYEAKPVRELADAVQASVIKNFKQTPGAIVLSFALKPANAGKTAQAATP